MQLDWFSSSSISLPASGPSSILAVVFMAYPNIGCVGVQPTYELVRKDGKSSPALRHDRLSPRERFAAPQVPAIAVVRSWPNYSLLGFCTGRVEAAALIAAHHGTFDRSLRVPKQ
jgi:hypothetical protein